jgi:hypothetical protein
MDPGITLTDAFRRVGRRAITEASGRITVEFSPAIAARGVDLFSVGEAPLRASEARGHQGNKTRQFEEAKRLSSPSEPIHNHWLTVTATGFGSPDHVQADGRCPTAVRPNTGWYDRPRNTSSIHSAENFAPIRNCSTVLASRKNSPVTMTRI